MDLPNAYSAKTKYVGVLKWWYSPIINFTGIVHHESSELGVSPCRKHPHMATNWHDGFGRMTQSISTWHWKIRRCSFHFMELYGLTWEDNISIHDIPIHTYIDTYIHTLHYITLQYIPTYLPTYIHYITYIHTYIHIYIYKLYN